MNISPQPTFSIVTVVFNDAENLYKTIRSVSEQRYQAVQFIIIDGGSTDGTLKVIEENQGLISLWKSEKDRGIYDAMNKGLALATGDYINFLNAGDVFYNSDVLQRISDEIVKTDGEIIYGQALHKSRVTGHVSYVRGKTITADTLFRNVPFCHQALFVRRTVFDGIGFYDTNYKIVADYEWMIRYYNKRKTTNLMHFIAEVVVEYDTDGFSFKNIMQGVREKVHIANRSFNGKYFYTGNVYFFLDRIRVLIVIALYRLRAIQFYRKLKYELLKNKKLSVARK